MSATFVLVHGSFCNSSVWNPLSRELVLRGHRALAVDLPGHGFDATIPDGYLGNQDLSTLAIAPSGMAGINTADDVALVGDVVRRAAEHGPVILVGHSRGGLTITAVANEMPELLSRLVYIAAWCPVDLPVSGYAEVPEQQHSLLPDAAAIAVGNPAELGAIRLNWRTAEPAHLAILQELLLAGGSRAELLSYLQAHQPDEALMIDEQATRVSAQAWGRIPHSYIRLTEDRAFPLAMQDRLIREADQLTPDNPFDVHSLASSHIGFQLNPAETAAILDRLAAVPARLAGAAGIPEKPAKWPRGR